MNIVEKRLDEIRPYENNPRRNDEAVQYVAESIRQFGWKQPIVIDRDGVIIAGHTRYKAAHRLGLKTVPCLIAEDLTPEQVKAYRLADNKVSEISDWDFDALASELDSLEIDMSVFSFSITDEEEKDGYIEEFFERGVEAKQKPDVFGLKITFTSREQMEECRTLLTEAGYEPDEI